MSGGPCCTASELIHMTYPQMAVEVVEAAAVHEAVVRRIVGGRAAGGECRVGELVDGLAAVGRDAQDRLGARPRVGERLAREVLEAGGFEQHHPRLLADDHAGARLVGELLVELEAERREVRGRSLHVGDGDVDEDRAGSSGHGGPPGFEVVLRV